MAVRQAGVANQDASLHAVTGAGWALTRMTGPRKIHNAASVESTPPRIIVWTTPTVVPRIPPRTPPRGNVPQTMVRMVAFIRPCTRSGVIAWRRLTWLMLYTGTVIPVTRPVAPSTSTGAPRRASGVRSRDTPPTTIEVPSVNPRPRRREIQDAINAPSRLPTLPIAKMIPTTAAERWRSRYMKTRRTAPNTMIDPKLVVAVQAAIRHRIGFLKTTMMPSFISAMKPVAPDAPAGLGSGSGVRCVPAGLGPVAGVRMVVKATPDTRKDKASTATAFAPPIHWIRKPAIAGPETWATDRLISSLVLPSSRLDRSTSTG